MYNRQAKGIDADTWSDLMKPTDWKEVRNVINENGSEKSAGWDGVNCDLVNLHCENSINSPSPFLEILTYLINVALQSGKTIKSWRKAIISMIPKRKEDGSFTSKIGEMRPISVLQEFGKISAKLLSDRLGMILLRHPRLLNPAQRAFLKDGCTAQCIDTLLNVLEDFQEKKRKKPSTLLFLLAYDQVKAYDSVQSYTIQASLERFNLPTNFITYVLSNLESATSCFKTYYGPTEDFGIETSVRQGDPLSPLIYILVTDALHEGLLNNPLYRCRTGYRFSNMRRIRVASLGYADDTLTLNESWEHQWMSHEWIRDFCQAHNFRLNALKCKYIISNHSGSEDGRWLWSVDGLEKIRPLPITESFRYLGLWLSMDLNWSKQISILNKMIMDWRWKSLAAKVDPAQLRNSYAEYLLPRLSLGLLYTNVTELMCNAWMRTIIHTLCAHSGFVSDFSLNPFGFCIIADIPNMWLRTQTTRATELLCSLNSRNSAAGSSTVARFCACMNASDPVSAAKKFSQRKKFPSEPSARMVSTLRYLYSQNIKIIYRSDQKSMTTSPLIQEINSKLSRMPEGEKIIAYTDGSTAPRAKQPNSGSGIFITDMANNELWSGGLVVRTDGNNFIAEMAAAAVVLKACPPQLSLQLRIDSTATIGAITQGIVSERRRVRAAGRAWLNLCRSDFIEKERSIKIEHISSHKGLITAEQQGNDAADRLANRFRIKGESSQPAPYLLETEESLLFQHKNIVVQGDPRVYLKRLELQKMIAEWKEKAPKQAGWYLKHPTQVTKQAKNVWKWSTESGNGDAWLYFIFAICQWLPTNHRMNYTKEESLRKCNLCLSSAVEKMDHLLCCPALVKEHLQLKDDVKQKLRLWDVPYSSIPFKSRELEFRARWRAAARERVSPSITNARLDILTSAYWRSNITKPLVSTRSFMKDLTTSIGNRFSLPCVQLRHDLVALLAQIFTLQTHAFTDILNFSPLFDDWTSVNESDTAFGAKLWRTPSLHSGRNSFIFLAPNSQINFPGFLEVLCETLQSKMPTRFLCVIPKVAKLPTQCLELASFNTNAPLFYSCHGDPISTPSTTSIVLAMNKESNLTDPINWESFKEQLSRWSAVWQPGIVSVSVTTNTLFAERSPLLHNPRALSSHQNNLNLQSCSIINFFDAYAPKKPCTLNSLPSRAAELIGQMNRHPTFLGVLGILPNQLRSLLKETGHKNREDALLDLSHTLFFAGFRVWKRRQQLANIFWNEVIKRKLTGMPKRKKRKRKQLAEMDESKCQNPFHYLHRHSNLSNQRPTKCPCRNRVEEKIYINQCITDFTSHIPSSSARTDFFITDSKTIPQKKFFRTRTDVIRKEHDRGKKRSFKQLTLDFSIANKRKK